MQHGPLRDGAAAGSMALITLGTGSCLSLATAGLPPEHGDTWASQGSPWGPKGCSTQLAPAEYSWCGEAAAGGGTEHPTPFPCPARLPLPGWALLVPVGDSMGTVLGITVTHSLSSAGHSLAGEQDCPSTQPCHPLGQTAAHGVRGTSPEEVSGSPTILPCFQEPHNIPHPTLPT